jgi:hypothetical protein
MRMRAVSAAAVASSCLCGCLNVSVHEVSGAAPARARQAQGQGSAGPRSPAPSRHAAAQRAGGVPDDWRAAEQGILAGHVQLTFPGQFVKAGEAYFSPDGRSIIFQAVDVPPPGKEPGEYYSMYVAPLRFDERGRIGGIETAKRLSPLRSFSTCGWFDPLDPAEVIFACTIVPPSGGSPGYQRDSRDYRWRFPVEMDIFRCRVAEADGTAAPLRPLVRNPSAYLAECSLSADGRHLLYCSMESNEGDLYVRDLQTDRTVRLIGAPGYDGGPFFSPDSKRICYRSDRRRDDLLQIFVADLAFDERGGIKGVAREYQLTDNGHVNFAPFWHPGGRFLVYVSSEQGHQNYEVFVLDADPGDLPGSPGPLRYGTRLRRITHAGGFDGFPAFSADGRRLIWTSQRDGSRSQVWVADLVMELDSAPSAGAP